MIYIYDLVLNLNEFIMESYEWDNEDEITHVKRIPCFRVSHEVMDNFYNYNVEFPKEFLEKLYDSCEIFKNRRIEKYNYLFLVTDLESVLGLELNNEGKIIGYSKLLFDEEDDVISLTSRIDLRELDYKILGKKDIIFLETRREVFRKNFLQREFVTSYEENNFNKLHFIYEEYFNKKASNIDKIYKDLLSSLDNYNNRHDKLYELLLLSIKKQV